MLSNSIDALLSNSIDIEFDRRIAIEFDAVEFDRRIAIEFDPHFTSYHCPVLLVPLSGTFSTTVWYF